MLNNNFPVSSLTAWGGASLRLKRRIGFIEHDHKFVFNLRNRRVEYYDLSKDPEELHNLSKSYPWLMKRYSSEAKAFANSVKKRDSPREIPFAALNARLARLAPGQIGLHIGAAGDFVKHVVRFTEQSHLSKDSSHTSHKGS